MKTWTKALVCISLSFMFCFLCVGYAALSNTLSIEGSAEATPPEGLYFITVEVDNATLTTKGEEIVKPTSLDSTIRGVNRNSVTYAITVFNNTPYVYAYSGWSCATGIAGYTGNSQVGKSGGVSISVKDSNGGTLNRYDQIQPYSTMTFYATYTLGKNVQNQDIRTLVYYQFGINMDSVGQVAIDRALIEFGKILNDPVRYQTLIERIDDKYNGADWSSNFIGNVAGAEGIGEIGVRDTATIMGLFGDQLVITIDGQETTVKVIIKREDVDGNRNTGDTFTARYGSSSYTGTGCEMTLYMTVADLDRSGANDEVYAAVFTCDTNTDGTYSEWYRVGDLYKGTAQVVGYVGNTATQNVGSFDTGTWRATAGTYTVSDAYSYSVGSGSTIQTITQAVDANAINRYRTLLEWSYDVLNGVYGNFSGSAVATLEETLTRVSRCYTLENDGTIVVSNSTTRSQLIPLIKELEVAILPFLDMIN